MLHKDVLSGALLVALAAAYFAASTRIPVSSLSDGVGPARLPMALAVLLAIVGLVLAGRALLHHRPRSDSAAGVEAERHAPPLRAAGLAAIAVAYALLVSWIGYAVAIAILIAAVAIYEGQRPSLRMALIAGAGALAFWALFVKLLGVPQPPGVLG